MAGIAFSKPVNWLTTTVSPREYRWGKACGPGGTLRWEGGSWRPMSCCRKIDEGGITCRKTASAQSKGPAWSAALSREEKKWD
jgi:hypothetical protein